MTALLKILGTQQRFSTAYHTQTDGQTERMNRILEDILRHFVAPHHTDWDEHIAMAEFAIDNSHQDQESINTTPFRLNIFKDPPTPLSNKQGCKVPAAQAFANKMQEALLDAKKALKAAQQRRKKYADQNRRHVTFTIGNEALLSSKNIRHRNLGGTPKFLSRWIGPFTIIDHASRHRPSVEEPGYSAPVAFKLDLPETMHVHYVFHVSLIKPDFRDLNVWPPPLPTVVEGKEWFGVEQFLNHRDIEVIVHRATKSTSQRNQSTKRVLCQLARVHWWSQLLGACWRSYKLLGLQEPCPKFLKSKKTVWSGPHFLTSLTILLQRSEQLTILLKEVS